MLPSRALYHAFLWNRLFVQEACWLQLEQLLHVAAIAVLMS